MISAILGFALLVGVAACGFVVAHRHGFGARRIVLDVIGIVLGGLLGSAPGLYVLVGHAVVVATGSSAGSWFLPELVTSAGLGIGVLGGLWLADKLSPRSRWGWKAILGALLGLVLGGAVALCGVHLGQQGPLELPALIAAPLAMVGATLGGCALLQPGESRSAGA
jgi:peptidoglycan/LPS O-acetylase OafA/YrhL